ncbi:MAG: lysostaphin resistance A-like protein [Planctomycetota bacterium]
MKAKGVLSLAFTLLALSMTWWWPLASDNDMELDKSLAILSALQILLLLGGWVVWRPSTSLLGLRLTPQSITWTLGLGLGLLALGLWMLSTQGAWRWKEPGDLPGREALVWMAAYKVILGPLFEELCFRSHFQGLVESRLGPWAAYIVVFFMFVACHAEAPLTLLLGAAGMGFLRAKTGSMWPALALHVAGNAFIIGCSIFLTQ